MSTRPSSPNHALTRFSALVDGRKTGLAGCGSTDCSRRCTCLRASSMLEQRWRPDPLDCRFWISNDGERIAKERAK